MQLQQGEVIEQRYSVERVLGDGGMATVYLVRHTVLNSRHALKVLDPVLARQPDIRGRFMAEGRIQAQLRHPSLVPVTDVVITPGIAAIVMDFVDGPSLAEILESSPRPRDVVEVRELLLPVLSAVGVAHDAGIVHRDLKPSNIVIGKGPDGAPLPRVLDFGIAHLSEGASVEHRKAMRTATGTRMGTIHYSSPEQIRAPQSVDRTADIFSLGVILYELATGRQAFPGNTDYDVMEAIVKGSWCLPKDVAVLPLLGSCIEKAMSLDPARRFQTCQEFAEALSAEEAIDDSFKTMAPRVSARGAKKATGGELLLAFSGLVVVLVAVVLGSMAWSRNASSGLGDDRTDSVIQSIRRGVEIHPTEIEGFDCGQLWKVRNWVFARHGYSFGPTAMKYFGSHPQYVPNPAVTDRTVERFLTAADEATRDMVLAQEKALGCRR